MFCKFDNPAQRRYVNRMLWVAAMSVLFALVTALTFRLAHPHGIAAWLMAVLPALPIMGALLGTGLYLADENDEFQRNLLVQSLLGGMAGVLAAVTV